MVAARTVTVTIPVRDAGGHVTQARIDVPVLASAPAGGITHGSQITPDNTGYAAYIDPTLGRAVKASDLQTISGVHWVSDFVSAGGTLSRKNFTGTLIIDVDNVTLRACRFVDTVSGYLNGKHAKGWAVDYCTWEPSGTIDECLHYQGYTATRCLIQGGSDGAKVNGAGTTLVECYIRTKAQSSVDHNDGLQNVGGSGAVTIKRCNIDCRPVGGGGGPNSALFFADGETGLHTVHDNLLAGGQYALAMYDGGTFDVQGNVFAKDTFVGGPVAVAGPGSGWNHATWGTVRPNTLSDGTVIPAGG